MLFFKKYIVAKSKQNLIFKFFIGTLLIFLLSPKNNFPASEWTGNTSTDWGVAGNWSGTPPSSSTSDVDIMIPGSPSGGRFPVLIGGTYSIKTLLLESGATLTQAGGTLIVNDDFTIKSGSPSGEMNQTDGILQLKKSFKNEGIFNSTGGTVRFSPSANGGTFKGSNQFFNIEIDDGVLPAFDDSDNNNIHIAGNFVNNNPDFSISYKATFTFNGTGNQTIYSASLPLPANTTFGSLIIDKPAGTIQLLSDVAVENTFTEINSTLNLNGHTLWVASNPLPVELSYFSAILLENGIKLNWRTETEISNFGFEVQRSTANVQSQIWQTLGFVDGHGNSNSPKDYSFIDENTTAGKFSYRLKQIDTDGKFEYSKIIKVNFGSPINYELSQNYPNPFNPSTSIRYSVSERSMINLSIFNSIGEKVEELENEVKEPGVYTIEFSAKNYPSGTYLYRIQSDNFTSVKKMILVK